MKSIGVLKLGSRITWDARDTTGGLGEIKALLELLASKNEFTINVYTKLLKDENTNPIKNINIIDNENINYVDDDILLIACGNVTWFGGEERAYQLHNFEIINSFKGKIYYIWIDPNLYLKQIWKSVESKPWGYKYKRENIEITRKDINVISLIHNIDVAYNTFLKGGVEVLKENFYHYNFAKYILLDSGLDFLESTDYDLLYMGTFRSGKRQDKMLKFYFDIPNFKVDFIGNTQLKDFKNIKENQIYPNFNSPVKFNDVKYYINKAKASVAIGDKIYNNNLFTPRVYEAINYSTVCLVDIDLDTNKRFFKSNELKSFNYVSSKKDVIQRVEKLKNNDFRKYIINLQKEDIDFNKDEYYDGLVSIINKD